MAVLIAVLKCDGHTEFHGACKSYFSSHYFTNSIIINIKNFKNAFFSSLPIILRERERFFFGHIQNWALSTQYCLSKSMWHEHVHLYCAVLKPT